MYQPSCAGMRVLWISYLLLGGIACFPIEKESGANGAHTSALRQPLSSWNMFSGMERSSDRGSSSRQPSVPSPSSHQATGDPAPQDGKSSAGQESFRSSPDVLRSTNTAVGHVLDGGYASFEDGLYNSPEVRAYGVGYSGYDRSAPDGSLDSAPIGDSRTSDPSAGYNDVNQIPKAVFSDVSDLQPVYSFSSHSSYQRGRTVFARSRYTPRAHGPQVMLVQIRKSAKQSLPAKTPTKRPF